MPDLVQHASKVGAVVIQMDLAHRVGLTANG